MNRSIIRYVLGIVVLFMGAFLLLPTLVALIYGEKEWQAYLMVSIPAIILGSINYHKKPKSTVFYLKEGCVATAASWVVLSLIGALPPFITGEIPSYLDALFEIISGFTTTGASILDNVELLSHATLFWRSFTHLVGGMGVLVFLLAVMPMGGGSQMNLMRAESPGPSVGKLVPKLHTTARMLYIIYAGLCVLEFFFLLFGGMPAFDAVNTAMATAGTGGFGIYADSCASFSVYSQWVVTVFMILFGVNFNAYYLILYKQAKAAFKMEEVRVYFIIAFSAMLVIIINSWNMFNGLGDALTKASFQVASIMSSTGFATTDFALWPQTSRFIIVMLSFIGACAGSTGGGIKVSRILIVVKSIRREINSYIHPRSVKNLDMDGKPLDKTTTLSTVVYMTLFLLIFAISAFLVSFEDLDFSTTFTAVLACVNNIGPGLSQVGPSCNFGFLSPLSKVVLMFDMLAGRLELFPLIMLIHPKMWIDMATVKEKRN